MVGRAHRRLLVTVRGAGDLPATAARPYVELRLGDQAVCTQVAGVRGVNPVRPCLQA